MMTIDGFWTTCGALIGKLTHPSDDFVCFILLILFKYTCMTYGSIQLGDISKVFCIIWARIGAIERINYRVSAHMISMCQIVGFLYVGDMNFDAMFQYQFIIHITHSFKHSTIIHMSSNIIRVNDNSIDALLFASIATRITCKILAILIHQVGDGNASVVAIVIIISQIMYFNTSRLYNVCFVFHVLVF